MSRHADRSASPLQLILCIVSIYAAYLSWAILQERIATTPYGSDKKIFRASLVLNTAQSLAATVTGSIYLLYKKWATDSSPPLGWATIYPSRTIFCRFLLIAMTSSLASPFGYASLRYIDYPTQILGKSCKLLPVMALGVLVYGRRFPPHKYLVVGMVTTGVALFTFYNGSSSSSSSSSRTQKDSSWWGLFLLSINLILDGLTNSTQDDMFRQFPTKITGPSMMVGLNALSTLLVSLFLASGLTAELQQAHHFTTQHPRVIGDIALFALCGAFGQLAIFHTLERFGSLLLVTVTLTRKMFTMLLSVLWFNHPLTPGQYLGVALVFGGISAEALLKSKDSTSSAKRDKKT